MIKRHSILFGILIGVLLLVVATFNYPGGSSNFELSEGYDWFNNYISDLLNPKAVNGMGNSARPWAIVGIFFLTASFGYFFVKFSDKINERGASNVIKYLGIIVTVLALLTAIPSFHDLMVTISSIITLIIFFYITVYAFKSRLIFLKFCSPIFSIDLLSWCIYVFHKVIFGIYAHYAKDYFCS